jgi:hypothetical protein
MTSTVDEACAAVAVDAASKKAKVFETVIACLRRRVGAAASSPESFSGNAAEPELFDDHRQNTIPVDRASTYVVVLPANLGQVC